MWKGERGQQKKEAGLWSVVLHSLIQKQDRSKRTVCSTNTKVEHWAGEKVFLMPSLLTSVSKMWIKSLTLWIKDKIHVERVSVWTFLSENSPVSPAAWRNRIKLCENGNYLSLQTPEFFLSWRREGTGQLHRVARLSLKTNIKGIFWSKHKLSTADCGFRHKIISICSVCVYSNNALTMDVF